MSTEDIQRSLILESIQTQISANEAKIEEFFSLITELEEKNKSLSSILSSDTPFKTLVVDVPKKKRRYKWVDEVKKGILELSRPMYTSELYQHILRAKNETFPDLDEKTIIHRLQGAVHQLKKVGNIRLVENSLGDHLIILPSWLYKDNMLREKYFKQIRDLKIDLNDFQEIIAGKYYGENEKIIIAKK